MISNQEKEELNKIIESLIHKGISPQPKLKFSDEDIENKYEILKIICGVSSEKEKDDLNIQNIFNIKPINSPVQQKIMTFIYNMEFYSINEMIQKYDSLSISYFQLKDENDFINFLKVKKFRMIPFFTMLGFASYMNLKRDTSDEVSKLAKSKYMKDMISHYIIEKRKSLASVILYYIKAILEDDNNEENTDVLQTKNLLIQGLNDSFQRYMCFNNLYDEGEISNLVYCLFKVITSNVKSLYLAKGPEYLLINGTIKYIFEEIIKSFTIANYFQKSKMNTMYDNIANIINILAEESFEENYAKLVVKYCKRFNQGNRNIVFTFFLGLNPDYFREAFNCLKFPDNKNEDFYQNIQDYIEQISSKKKKRIKKDKKLLINNIEEKKDNEDNNSQYIKSKDNGNETIDNLTNQNKDYPYISNEKIEKINTEDIKKIIECNNQLMLKNEEVMNEIKEMKKKNEELMLKNDEVMNEIKEIKKQNEEIIQEGDKKTQKLMNSIVKMKSQLCSMKNEMRQISYRDISKLIINNYIDKYEKKLGKEMDIKKRKDKATKIIEYIKGNESTYYKRLVNKYYDSNHVSHISKFFEDLGLNYIIGLTYNKNELIDKVLADYCKIFLEENNDNKTLNEIDNLFGVKKIISEILS